MSAMKLKQSIHETKTVTSSVSLSTGGFVQLEQSELGDGYLKVHLQKEPDNYILIMNQAWRYIIFAKDKKLIETATELRDALTVLIDSITN